LAIGPGIADLRTSRVVGSTLGLLVPALLVACGGRSGTSPEALATCIHDQGGVAVVQEDAAEASAGIPGHVDAGVEFNFPGRTVGTLDLGFVFFERSSGDADRAYDALRRGAIMIPPVPGVDLSRLPKLNLAASGQIERHDKQIVLWLTEKGTRRASATRALDSCLG
jgi:hypothetical protein